VDGSKEVVGDMDSGMDVDTILLANTATDAGTCGPTHRKCLSYTPFGGGDMLTCGNYTHGTNTAQCAVGNGSDLGIDSILDGVAKHAKIVFQDIQQSTPLKCALGALDAPATFVAMYDQVRSFGGHLTNGSFSACSAYGSYANEADQYTWDHKDFLMTFSAGNGGNGLVCPGTAKNVIAAGGFYQDPFFDFFGSTGPSESGRMGPTVMGPACDHSGGNPAPYNYDTSTSVQSADTDITGVPDNIISQGACGTSFSSPYSMGAAALVRDYFEKGFYPSGSASTGDAFAPTGALVKAVLLTSGDLMTCCGSFMTSTSTYGQGMGRIDLARVLHVSGDARTVPALRVVDKGAAAGVRVTFGAGHRDVDDPGRRDERPQRRSELREHAAVRPRDRGRLRAGRARGVSGRIRVPARRDVGLGPERVVAVGEHLRSGGRVRLLPRHADVAGGWGLQPREDRLRALRPRDELHDGVRPHGRGRCLLPGRDAQRLLGGIARQGLGREPAPRCEPRLSVTGGEVPFLFFLRGSPDTAALRKREWDFTHETKKRSVRSSS